jgi:hypothetical protein
VTCQLKPQIVDEVSSPNGHVKLPVYFDRNEKDFYVEVTGPDDRVRADSVAEIKKLAKEKLATAIEYKWEGIIVLELEQSYDAKYKAPGSYQYRGQKLGAQVEFEFDRMERSKHPTRPGHFVYRSHTIDFEAKNPDAFDRKQREENRNFRQLGARLASTTLPYDDETWQGLLAMKKAVDAAQAQLEALVERKDLSEKLRLIGKQPQAPMLPAAAGSTSSEPPLPRSGGLTGRHVGGR